MKNPVIICLFAAVLIIGCANIDGIYTDGSSKGFDFESHLIEFADEYKAFSGAIEKEWKLLTFHIDGIEIWFRHGTNTKDIFTIKFDDRTISGTGAPNLFSGNYYLHGNRFLLVYPFEITTVAAFVEPESLSERDFLSHLYNIHTWKLTNNSTNLELDSESSYSRRKMRMVFGL
ncbi:MAG: META domain-containing protein [Treponema sp.]|nr:META domain-containing protein [Treponema sp.]